jgi:hypothetical protein
MMQLKKASRKKVKMRMNISGPSGAGKTYSALLLAFGITSDWNKIAVIDTENSSASLYEHLGAFNVIDLAAPFTPERYIEAIDTCVKAGIEVIIMDSSTHEWDGIGGCKDANEKLAAAKYKGNSWAAWSETSPRHDKFVEKVLQCPVHVITCTRSKMETVMTDDKKVKKVGMKDIQREGWEYELTLSLSLDRDTHMALPSKDRTELFEGKQPFIVTPETGKLIKDWCEKGVEENNIPATNGSTTKPDSYFKPPAKEAADFINIWEKEINGQTTKSALLHLYNNHKATVDADARLRQLFKSKQETFNV